MLTEAQHKALKIVRDHGPIRPREFAKAMWPDSPGWKRHCKCGPGGCHQGGGMYTAGGAYLGKLARKGWVMQRSRRLGGVYSEDGYILTHAGLVALRQAEAA